MAIVNMTALKMSLASHSSNHQHSGCIIFQVEIVGGVRPTVTVQLIVSAVSQTVQQWVDRQTDTCMARHLL